MMPSLLKITTMGHKVELWETKPLSTDRHLLGQTDCSDIKEQPKNCYEVSNYGGFLLPYSVLSYTVSYQLNEDNFIPTL